MASNHLVYLRCAAIEIGFGCVCIRSPKSGVWPSCAFPLFLCLTLFPVIVLSTETECVRRIFRLCPRSVRASEGRLLRLCVYLVCFLLRPSYGPLLRLHL